MELHHESVGGDEQFEPAVLPLVEAAGGDSVLLAELRAGLRAEGMALVGDRPRTPRRVQDLVRDRLRAVGPARVAEPAEAWQLLRVAAVLGRRFEVSELASMMRLSIAGLLPVVDPLLEDGVLEWSGEDLAFRQKLVWWAVLDSLPSAVRNALRADRDRLRGDSRPVNRNHADELSRSIALVRAALGRPAAARFADDLHGLLANLFILRGLSEAARATAERVLGTPGGRLADEATGARLAALALAGDPGAEAAAEAVLAAAPPSSSSAVAASFVLSNMLWGRGKIAAALRMAGHHAQVGVGGAAPHWLLAQQLGVITKLGLLRRLDEANVLMRATGAELEARHLQSYEGHRVIVEARLLLTAGQLTAADERAAAGIAIAREAGSPLLVPQGLAVRAEVALRTGDLDTAAHLLAECEAVRSRADCVPSTLHTWAAVRLAERRHGPARAVALVADPAERWPLLIEEPGAAPWLVHAAVAAGDLDLAREIAGDAVALAVDNAGFPTLVAAAAHARAYLDGDAAALARVTHVDGWAAELARAHLAELRRAAHRRDPGEWESFSGIEKSIARLVAEGMTNRQIATRVRLSPHTVNYHLRVLFRKLGISSRTELVRHVPNSTAA